MSETLRSKFFSSLTLFSDERRVQSLFSPHFLHDALRTHTDLALGPLPLKCGKKNVTDDWGDFI